MSATDDSMFISPAAPTEDTAAPVEPPAEAAVPVVAEPTAEEIQLAKRAERSRKATEAHAKRKARLLEEAAIKAQQPADETSTAKVKLLDEQPVPVVITDEIPIGQVPDTPPAVELAVPEGHVHTVHVLVDGMTLAGAVRYRGDEVTVLPDTPEYDLVHDRDGKCLLAIDEDEQWDRWGSVKFAPGPWRGRGYDLQARFDSGDTLTEQEKKLLHKLNNTRGLAAPRGV